MNQRIVKVLAVGDPAVAVYTDPKNQILETFSKEYDCKIQFDIIPWENYFEQLMEDVEKNHEYDVIMVAGHLWIDDFVKNKYIIPLKDELEDDFVACVKKEMYFEGKRYLYPSFCDGHMLVYRLSMLSNELQEVIQTSGSLNLDDLEALCKQYVKVMKAPAIALKAHPSEIYLDALPYIRQAGANDDMYPAECAERGLNQYIRMKEYAISGTETFGNEEVLEAIVEKKVPFVITWGGQLGLINSVIKKEDNDLNFKAVKDGFNTTWSFGITQKGNFELVYKFMEYLTSKNVDRMVGAFAGSPTRYSTYETDKNNYDWYMEHLKFISADARNLDIPKDCAIRMGAYSEALVKLFDNETTTSECVKSCIERN